MKTRIGRALLMAALWSPFAVAAAPDGAAAIASDNAAFACDLYGVLKGEPGNLFLSPHSISTALAMTFGGARGKTADEMAKTMRFDRPPEQLHAAFAALERRIAEVQTKGKVTISVANSLWPQKDYPFLPAFTELCRKSYGAGTEPVDYVRDTEGARKLINGWVENKTNKRIRNLIPPGILDALTRLVLVNAIYFKGDWAVPFKESATKDQPFHVAADRTVQAPLMAREDTYGYAEVEGLQVAELPYAGDDLSMVVLLPSKDSGIDKLEASLTAENLAKWMSGLRRQRVSVFLPRFKTTASFSLKKTMQALGMKEAFAAAADFSGMTGTMDLFIGAILHKAFVEVNEKGTEAAAATAVVMTRKSAMVPRPAPVFRADRPFLYLIRDRQSGAILFLGRLSDPTMAGE